MNYLTRSRLQSPSRQTGRTEGGFPAGPRSPWSLAAACAIALWTLLCGLLIERWGQMHRPDLICVRDGVIYSRLAHNLIHFHTFSMHAQAPHLFDPFHVPGYPVLLALMYRAFGERQTPVIAAQVVMLALTVFLTYLVGRALFGDAAGILASLILSLDVNSMDLSQSVMTEASFVLLLVLTIWLLVRRADRSLGRWTLALSGTLLAACAFVRPVVYYLPILLVLACVPILPSVKRGLVGSRLAWRRAVLNVAAFLLPSVVLFGAWQAYVRRQTGYSGFCGTEPINMYYVRAARVLAFVERLPLQESLDEQGAPHLPANAFAESGVASDSVLDFRVSLSGYAIAHPDAAGISLSQWLNRIYREGLSVLMEHPWQTLRSELREKAYLMLTLGQSELALYLGIADFRVNGLVPRLREIEGAILGRSGPGSTNALPGALLVAWAAVWLAALYIGAGVWLVKSLQRRPDPRLLIPVVVVLYLFLVSPGYSRYRDPMTPFLSVFAAAGWLGLVRTRPRRDALQGDSAPSGSGSGTGNIDPEGGRPAEDRVGQSQAEAVPPSLGQTTRASGAEADGNRKQGPNCERRA